MAECICSDIIGIFADECTGVVVDSLGNTYYQVWCSLQRRTDFLNKSILVKVCFRKVDQNRVVVFELSGQCAGSSEPSGMASHNLNNGNGFFIVINGCVASNLPYSRSYVFCGTSKSRCVICLDKVIINCFWNSDHTDVAADLFGIAGKLADSIHGIIASDVEEISDVVCFEACKKLWINRIVEIFRKLVSAGAKI